VALVLAAVSSAHRKSTVVIVAVEAVAQPFLLGED
jgi:hypothetical protein